jgi:hypothetical protein
VTTTRNQLHWRNHPSCVPNRLPRSQQSRVEPFRLQSIPTVRHAQEHVQGHQFEQQVPWVLEKW